ncbi:hypothetical protein M409DRAFT_70892 [Zasmidium cellare ATCC 36951]|uniref:Ketoreductase (KR) domain-containing protein n=1 Tax=Zasmidium cellare ATCC 36951 TaxID=1080233 RepID=A0A6A6BXY0_ZASCE|nr:uncharacterized protein M409DRAFT_70892 [Zasmidium cellare ATCC 36951]KAF2159565.1 hypothetical protein M409DRAFT_70892 [Zasmidium cellare ATCC 36951]
MVFQVLSHFVKQSFFLPNPRLTEENLPNQSGRVFIVTGGYAGVGDQLSQILYSKNGTIYIAGRSKEKAESAMVRIQKAHPSSKGRLEFLKLDLGDLTTIKPAVESFLSQVSRLDVLINNAGVMFPPIGSKSTQGHEMQMATNCLGHFLLARLLSPVLERTASAAAPGAVRIAWAASFGVDALSPKGGVSFDKDGAFEAHGSNNQVNYGATKAGNLFLASQFARKPPIAADGKGMVNVAFNPGNLRTELQRHSGKLEVWVVDKLLLNPAILGAYTELWCGWSEDVKPESNGAYAWPWGRFGPVRDDVEAELADGGKAEMFWRWCEKETRAFA